jgi:tRNA (guanine37-N1)-methyltransferase
MRIDIISAVPETMQSYIENSIIKIARDKGIVEIYLHNLHDYSQSKHKKIDDYPFGGASGMLLTCQPIFGLIEELKSQREYDEIIFTSAEGEKFNQSSANYLSLKKNIIILAGRYKGVDQRVRDNLITKEYSLGDFILTGGEVAALAICDATIRLLPGALGDSEAALTDSFMNGMLEEAQYTRPADFNGLKVPEVLLSGNHKAIELWRQENSYNKTKLLRPDLLD